MSSEANNNENSAGRIELRSEIPKTRMGLLASRLNANVQVSTGHLFGYSGDEKNWRC